MNRYAYVGNNPLRYTDPTGHRPCGNGEIIDCEGDKQRNEQRDGKEIIIDTGHPDIDLLDWIVPDIGTVSGGFVIPAGVNEKPNFVEAIAGGVLIMGGLAVASGGGFLVFEAAVACPITGVECFVALHGISVGVLIIGVGGLMTYLGAGMVIDSGVIPKQWLDEIEQR